MRRRFSKAIRDTGSIARIPDEGGKAFAARIQPLSVDGNGHDETGTGSLHRYKIYAVCDETTMSLREGSVLECNGGRYLVESIETIYLGGKPVFRQGVLAAGQGGEA